MKYLRWLLLPFSLLYGLVVIIRNWFYDAGFFKSYQFDKPVISIGNLDVGGAGKSPMAEYLIRLLKDDYKLATLSRGYGRETKGYLVGESRIKNQESGKENENSQLTTHYSLLSNQIGDEPAQFKHKFPDITVAVCEKRVEGLNQLLPEHDLVILDDAYQHRAVTAGLGILLFDYNRLNEPHLLLPAGDLREPFSGRWRAQVIVVTKCPATLTNGQKENAYQKVAPGPYQQLFFSTIAYQPLQRLDGKPVNTGIDKDTTVFLLTGIANAKPLLQYLNGFTTHVIHHKYPDHHPFTLKNITKLAAEFVACKTEKKLIITTEKDAQRLEDSWFRWPLPADESLPVFVVPIKVEFLDESGQQFDQLINNYVREHTTYNSIH
ncbi:tetraacyldisaccharide 4'-kinase [Mucilaginibacter gotjawali]|uniref:Tetraacyldisaccharide 4'-kinase n=2 Tax=Mucilaginibacter gotjawali TaxID=1550579 RepID=A0A110B486_9SPHI|nr:tetraacyldisaccharide 4'-kinase [Mucilaginibacter gotjawali]MBB3056868.1 tetraacyldisaccharide 4'-kinase [Mucilaginibacter gotjawali]BAU55948.1 Tetraacyldisaccharide 4'-kinase [Mucilaginibacter gotjawali]